MIFISRRFAFLELLLHASLGSRSNALVMNLCCLKAGGGGKGAGSCSVHIA